MTWLEGRLQHISNRASTRKTLLSFFVKKKENPKTHMIQKNCDYLVILSFGSIDVFSTIIYYLSFLAFPWQIDLFFFLFNPYTIDLVADTTRGNEEKNKNSERKVWILYFLLFWLPKILPSYSFIRVNWRKTSFLWPLHMWGL